MSKVTPVRRLIAEADELIRQGKGLRANSILAVLTKTRPPRSDALLVAEIARRCSQSDLAVRILNPIVRSPERRPVEATDAEKAEYGANLIRLGAIEEAMGLIAEINSTQVPEALLFQAYGHFSRWDYAQAIPLLERFINSPRISHYQRVLARVNLAASFVVEKRNTEAQSLLEELLEQTRDEAFHLLSGNLYEIGAQVALQQMDFERAKRFLDSATKQLSEAGGRDPFYVQKWKAFLNFKRNPSDSRSLLALRGIARQASESELWETIRACDRMEALVLGKQLLILHLYFGTPLEGFRMKLLAELPTELVLTEQYPWVLSPGKNPVEVDSLIEDTEIGRSQLSLLATLASDFYRPQRVAELHARIYPGEYYNPMSAPLRIRQAMHRLRRWFKERSWPLRIEEISGAYRLVADRPLVIWRPRVQKTLEEMQLSKVHRRYDQEYFSTSEAAKLLGISVRSAFSLLSNGVRKGFIVRIGSGGASRYEFVESPAPQEPIRKRAT